MSEFSQLSNLIKSAINNASKVIGVKMLNDIRFNMPEATGTLIKTTQLKISKSGDVTSISVINNQPYAKKQDIQEMYHLPLELGEKRIVSYFNKVSGIKKKLPIYRPDSYRKAYWALRKGSKGIRTGRSYEAVLKDKFAYNYSIRTMESVEPYANAILEKYLSEIWK